MDTRQRNNLYLPQTNLTIYQKGAYYSGIKIFNKLPLEIKHVADKQKKFKTALKLFYILTLFIHWNSMNYVLCYKISYYIGTSFEVVTMYII
jgi:hypothetical protein